MISEKRLYLTRDNRVVEENDPEAAELLVGAGCEIEPEVLQRHGLTAESLKARTPSANKALKPSGNK